MNPYSFLLNKFGWHVRNQPQDIDGALYVLLAVLEASYSSGFDGSVTPARYMLTQLEAVAGSPDQPAHFVERLRAKFTSQGML